MDIFESLENLNVSEECFNEIMGLVEELLNEDIYDVVLKSVDDENSPLRRKNAHGKINLDRWMETIRDNKKKELEDSAKREGVTPEGLDAKRNLNKNKNNYKTRNAQGFRQKSAQEKIDAARMRHSKKLQVK